jgi:hypothetical protein
VTEFGGRDCCSQKRSAHAMATKERATQDHDGKQYEGWYNSVDSKMEVPKQSRGYLRSQRPPVWTIRIRWMKTPCH